MISGEVFSDDDVKEINKYMSLAVNAAQYGKSQGMVRKYIMIVISIIIITNMSSA